MKNMTRILIPNTYTWYNKGDAGIVIGIVYALRKYIPNSIITTLSFTPTIDQQMYGNLNLTVLRNLLTVRKKSSVLNITKLVIKTLKYILVPKVDRLIQSRLIGEEEKDVLKAYNNSDIIVACGGGYLGGSKFSSLLHAYRIYLGKCFKKPTIICAQSIEPMPSLLIRNITKHILNKMDLIMVREEFSMRYLKSIGVKSNVILTADPAFIVPNVAKNEARRLLANEGVYKDSAFLVGITTREWDFRGYNNKKKRLSNYVSVIAKCIEYLVSKNAKVIFFPQVISYPDDDDRIISQKILSTICDKNVVILDKDYSPQEIKGMIGEMDLFIGTRMHSNIFSTSMGVPTIAISYQRKTEGIMDMLEMSDYVLSINDIKFEDLTSKINDLLNNKRLIKMHLLQKTEELKKLAYYNGELVKITLEKSGHINQW